MKKILYTVAALLALSGCNTVPEGVSKPPLVTHSESMGMSNFEITGDSEAFSNECEISLGEVVNISGEGAAIDENCITISESGVYKINGELENGIIYISCRETVKLIMENAVINNNEGAAIISQCEKLIIECSEGTENSLSDGREYSYSRSFENADKHEAALYTEGALLITGDGLLKVYGNKSEAVTAGNLTVKGRVYAAAEDNGIIADGGISLEGAELQISAEKDGIKTDSDISFKDSSITVDAGNDGVQAKGKLSAENAVFDILTSGNIEADAELSSKGIKAAELTLSQCDITINSTDHSLKSDGAVEISGGTLILSSSMGKGITAEGALTLSGGEITVSESNEGIESKSTLTINGGILDITSSDDGINTGGEDMTADHSIIINDGTVIVNAGGDGLDSNGNIDINGGTVVVFGPVSDGNSPLDWGERGFSLNLTGGKVLALGSMGMMMKPDESFFLSSALGAEEGDVITAADENGSVIISVTTPKTAQGIIFGGGENCRIYKNGTVTGEADENGIVTSGTVTGGTEITAGTGGGMGGFGGRGHGKRQEGEFPEGKPDMENRPEGMNPPELPDGNMPTMNETA